MGNQSQSSSILSKVVIGVASSLGTAGVLYLLAQGGGLIKQVFIPELPGGAVVAFNGRCPTSNGWNKFEPAKGRFIIGSGKGPLRKKTYTTEDGGREYYKISEDIMPSHKHALANAGFTQSETARWTFVDGGHGANIPYYFENSNDISVQTITNGTGPRGEGEEMRILPPYIALNYCIKD